MVEKRMVISASFLFLGKKKREKRNLSGKKCLVQKQQM